MKRSAIKQHFRHFSPLLTLSTALLDFLAPQQCVHCGHRLPSSHQEDREHSTGTQRSIPLLCTQCQNGVPFVERSVIRELRQRYPAPCAIANLWVLYRYTEPIAAVIHAIKYQFRRRAARRLGNMLGTMLQSQHHPPMDAIVPVPLHPARQRERGYNQSELLAMGVADILQIPVRTRWIRRSRWTASQTQLSDAERLANVQHAFTAGKQAEAVRGKNVLLIDDVVTTGATLCASAAALQHLGAHKIFAAAVAIAPR